jgi:serine/threonine protein kinase
MQKIVKILGMVPTSMIEKSSDTIRWQFFEKKFNPLTGVNEWQMRQTKPITAGADREQNVPTSTPPDPPPSETPVLVPSPDPIATLKAVITAGNKQQKKFPPSEAYNSQKNYTMFVDLVYKMLTYDPEQRIKPAEALNHPFIVATEQVLATSTATR